MHKQELFKQKYRNINPKWRESHAIYRNIIAKEVNSDTRILDVGCGHKSYMKTVYDKTPHTFGIDPDKEALNKNNLINNKIVGFVSNLPFEDDYFDLVVSEWVLEHLKNPEKAFQEIYRVLKPDGKVVFLTPNALNYNVWIIRTIPNRFHSFFTKKLYGRKEEDTYPVYYKINSVMKITKILGSIGFKKCELILNGDPTYISFNRPLFAFAILLEKLLNLKPFRFAKVHIIGVFKKT